MFTQPLNLQIEVEARGGGGVSNFSDMYRDRFIVNEINLRINFISHVGPLIA